MARLNLKNAATVNAETFASQQLGNGNNTLYTVPASKVAIVKKMVLTNVHATTTVNVTVSVLKSGQTVDGTHEVIHALALEPGDSYIVAEVIDMFLDEADSIRVNTSAASAIDAVLNGLVLA